MSEMLLETRNLTKQYGHHKAVDSVDMHIKKGAIYGFIGRNGAGKTTCLKMISGLSKPTCGEIEMFGYKGKDLQNVRSRVGCLIEAPGLYGNMTAYENLNIKCKLFGIKKTGYIEEILRIVGLEDVGKKQTKHFSLGMKQRLGIGLALVGEPDLLVLDEPINGLDPQGIAEIRDTIQRLRKERNMTICISSHILEELSKIATDYGIIHNGSAIYGFIGRNGAGKTTCLKMISGLSKPTCGEIEMFGYKGKDLQNVRSRVGCLIEAPGLYGNMTAYENLNIKCKLFGIKKTGYIEEILRIVGLEDVGKKQTKHFSLGMKQRLGIGLALVGEPDLLVLDEPINGLDPQGIAEIRDTIQRLRKERNMTICISSHILEELSKIATDYGIIHNGSLLQEITREELMRRCSERMELTLDHPKLAIPVLDSMGFTNFQVTDKEHIHIFERLNESAVLNMELAKAEIPVKGISITSEELETYFLNLTGGTDHA